MPPTNSPVVSSELSQKHNKVPHFAGGTKLPEVLESLFGRYKQLERQHFKSGFTSLIACIPALLQPTIPEQIRQCFARVSAEETEAWIAEHSPTTVHARRTATLKQFQRATNATATT